MHTHFRDKTTCTINKSWIISTDGQAPPQYVYRDAFTRHWLGRNFRRFFFFNLRGEFDIGSLGFSVLLFLSFSHINARGDCYNSTSRLRVILLFSCVTSKENDLLQEERLPAAAGRRKGSPPKKRIRCWCCSLLLLLLLLL